MLLVNKTFSTSTEKLDDPKYLDDFCRPRVRCTTTISFENSSRQYLERDYFFNTPSSFPLSRVGDLE